MSLWEILNDLMRVSLSLQGRFPVPSVFSFCEFGGAAICGC